MSHLKGFKELEKKLRQLDSRTSGKVLRNSLRSALLPAEQKAKLAVPIGKQVHRTYLGNLRSPGFLKRSIKRRSFTNRRGQSVAILGVTREAFYGVQFLERGTKNIKAQPWLEKSFVSSERQMIERLKQQLKKGIDKVAKR